MYRSGLYRIKTTLIESLRIHELSNALDRLQRNEMLKYELMERVSHFVENNLDEKLSNRSLEINEPDQLVMFSYDDRHKYNFGLAVIFNKKFCSLDLDHRFDDEKLFDIFINKTKF